MSSTSNSDYTKQSMNGLNDVNYGSITCDNIYLNGESTFNSSFPTSTLPTSTVVTTNSIVNKGMNDTLYSSKTNEVKTNTANDFTLTNTFQAPTNFSSISVTSGISSPYFSNRTTTDATDILTNTINLNSSGSNINIQTLPTIFTRTQNDTQPYNSTSVCSCQVLQTINNFYDRTYTPNTITVNTPLSVRQTGNINVATNLSWSMTFNITNVVAKVYIDGVLQNTISGTVNNQATNQVARTFTCSYSSGGIRGFTLDRYFFNFSFDINLDNYPTGIMTVFVDATLVLNMTINSYTGNFQVQQEPSIRFNTTTSTFSDTGSTTNRTLTYSPTSTNGTGYSAFSISSSTSTGTENLSVNTGTTYVNKIYTNGINQNTGTTTTNTLNNLTTGSLTTPLLNAGGITTDTLTCNSSLTCNSTFNFLPTGMIISYVGSSVPANCGWLFCDGSTLNADITAGGNALYEPLWNLIGTQFGGTAKSSFKLPDYRGAFLRGNGAQAGGTTYVSSALNTSQNHATQTHTHTATQAVHTHTVRFKGNGNSGVQTVGGSILFNPNATSFGSPSQIDITTGQRLDNGTQFQNVQPAITVDNSTTNVNANETRPFNYSVNYLIKY